MDKIIYLVWDGPEDIAGVFDTLKAAEWFVDKAVERTKDKYSYYVTEHPLNRAHIPSWKLVTSGR